jgi:excisionase family DNA binding protein
MYKTKKTTPVEAINSAILTKREAADYLRVSTRYLERAVKDARLRAYKPTCGTFRVRRSDLDAFLESGATTAGAA